MCLRSNKFFFAAGFATVALVTLCATNAEKNITIINENGNGGSLKNKVNVGKKLSTLKTNDYLLNNTTGDIYNYNYEFNTWMSYGNLGVHNHKAYISLNDGSRKNSVYRNKAKKESYGLYLSKNTEAICYLKKMHLRHWALRGFKFQFIIPELSEWDIHSFKFQNKNRRFQILGDSDRGP